MHITRRTTHTARHGRQASPSTPSLESLTDIDMWGRPQSSPAGLMFPSAREAGVKRCAQMDCSALLLLLPSPPLYCLLSLLLHLVATGDADGDDFFDRSLDIARWRSLIMYVLATPASVGGVCHGDGGLWSRASHVMSCRELDCQSNACGCRCRCRVMLFNWCHGCGCDDARWGWGERGMCVP